MNAPAPLTSDPLDNVPFRLRERPQWVCWRYLTRGGKRRKTPVNPHTGEIDDANAPGTWGTFDQAVQTFHRSPELAGVGYVFHADDPFCGIDLDDCIDAGAGDGSIAIKPWAQEIIDRLASYGELSPSGTGVKVTVEGAKPGVRCRTPYHDGTVEIYDCGRFFTVTGQLLPGLSAAIAARQAELESVYAMIFPPARQRVDEGPADLLEGDPPFDARCSSPSSHAADAPALDDDRIMQVASRSRSGAKFRALWAGDWQGSYPSQSEADSALVFILAFYTKDPAQLDRLFHSSGLMRPKWDEKHGEKTYGQITVDKALAMVSGQWRAGNRRADVAAAASQPLPVSPPLQPRPSITVDDVQLDELTSRAIEALSAANDPPVVFVRGGGLCRVLRDEHGVARADPFDRVKVRGRLAQVADFHAAKAGRGGPALVGVHPPLALAENVLALGGWPSFPPLRGIALAPILRPEGTVWATPGYDRQSQLLYVPAPGLVVPPIPDRPTAAQISAALDELNRLIGDFPFADAASRANALAILFSLLMRPAIDGHVPLAIVGAPVQGTGKSLLITALAGVAVGPVARESIPSKQNDDEWRKKITSILLSAAPFVLLDNIPDNSAIDSPALAAALTGREWSDRILGRSAIARLPSRVIWVATGNNLRVVGDMPRRCYTVNLDANAERPWERGGFAIADLESYALANRGRLLAAGFTLVRAWYAAGCPKASVPTIGSFQEWADAVGGVLALAGVEGFLTNLAQTRAVQDDDVQQWSAFFAAWWEELADQPVTVDALHRRVLATGPDAIALPEPLLVHKDKGDGSLKRSLGRHLARLAGRVFDGRKLHSPGADSHTKVRLWCLAPLANPANPAGSNANPAAIPATGGVRWQ